MSLYCGNHLLEMLDQSKPIPSQMRGNLFEERVHPACSGAAVAGGGATIRIVKVWWFNPWFLTFQSILGQDTEPHFARNSSPLSLFR